MAGAAAPGVRTTVSTLAYLALRAQGFAGVVVEFAQAVPVGELRCSAVRPTFLVIDVSDQCIAVGCGAPVAVPGADEGFEDSVEGATFTVAADDDAVAGDQAA